MSNETEQPEISKAALIAYIPEEPIEPEDDGDGSN